LPAIVAYARAAVQRTLARAEKVWPQTEQRLRVDRTTTLEGLMVFYVFEVWLLYALVICLV
jgi:hypothetical protein